MNKIFNTKIQTQNMELYEIFLKKIHIAVPKTKSDPLLKESFERVNESYFYGLIEQTNLQWGKNSTSKLGSYEYGNDTITISSIFRNAPIEFLDYVMYHEMLHKKHKFHTKNGKSYHHTRKFKREEKRFRNQEDMEKRMHNFIRQFRRRKSFFGLF
jgi:predicted metal-dependent hydrolase